MNKEEIKSIAKELLFMPRDELIKLLISVQHENRQLKDRINKAIDKLICCGEMLDARFQSDMLEILEDSDNNDE